MCRSIKQLRNRDHQPPTDEELQAAALQFVRKVSGYRVPSRANAEAFNRAVAAIAATTGDLLVELEKTRPGQSPKTSRKLLGAVGGSPVGATR